MARGNPSPSEVLPKGAIETIGVAAAGTTNIFTAETLPEGIQNFGEDAIAGAALATIGLALRLGLGRGHMSKNLLEWGLPTVAGLVAAGNDINDRGWWNTIGDLTIGASRFGTAFFTGRAITNAWLKDN